MTLGVIGDNKNTGNEFLQVNKGETGLQCSLELERTI